MVHLDSTMLQPHGVYISGDVGTVDGDDGLGNGFHIKSNNELVIGSNKDKRVGGLSSVSVIGCSIGCCCIGIATLALALGVWYIPSVVCNLFVSYAFWIAFIFAV